MSKHDATARAIWEAISPATRDFVRARDPRPIRGGVMFAVGTGLPAQQWVEVVLGGGKTYDLDMVQSGREPFYQTQHLGWIDGVIPQLLDSTIAALIATPWDFHEPRGGTQPYARPRKKAWKPADKLVGEINRMLK
jgi:hypothetical protein